MNSSHIPNNILQEAMDAACTYALNNAGNFRSTSLDLTPANGCWKQEQHVRLILARELLNLLPEPTLPVVDGKTPGQVAYEGYNEHGFWIQSVVQHKWEAAASAVLAAFGGRASGWKTRAEKAETEVAMLKDWKAQQLQVESEWDCQMLAKKLGVGIGQSCRAGIQKAVLTMLEQPLLPQLRPISEAGDVPEGCHRLFFALFDNCAGTGWPTKDGDTTHFADIRLPNAPVVNKPEPQDPYAELKKAHAEGKVIQVNVGKRFNPEAKDCWEVREEPAWDIEAKFYRIKPDEPDTFTAHGWRYADVPQPELSHDSGKITSFVRAAAATIQMGGVSEPAWTPKVGDLVQLKSGGPVMTFDFAEHDDVYNDTVYNCMWIKPCGNPSGLKLPLHMLKPAKEEQP